MMQQPFHRFAMSRSLQLYRESLFAVAFAAMTPSLGLLKCWDTSAL